MTKLKITGGLRAFEALLGHAKVKEEKIGVTTIEAAAVSPRSQTQVGSKVNPDPVAQTEWDEEGPGVSTSEPSIMPITLIDESNSIDYIDMANRIILSLIGVFGIVSPRRANKIFEEISKKGFFNVQTLSALYVVNNEKIVTFHDLTDQLKMPESTAHRILRQLVSQGVIDRISKVRNRNGYPGPRVTLYGLPGRYDRELEACLKRERTRTIEGFKLYEELQQLLITEYLEPNHTDEIHYWTLCRVLRSSWNNPGYHWGDVYEKVASGLKQKGYTVPQ